VEKIGAITQYFRQNYKYEFGITIPKGQDALSYFLLERPSAHCEYFAAGATMLLRLSGVPCRYVTGFVTVEKNTFGAYWVARNRDAHAWAEAWDDSHGWITVEATPAAGVPTADTASTIHSVTDAFRFIMARALALFREKGAAALLIVGATLLRLVVYTVTGRVLLASVLLLYALRFLRNFKRRPKPKVAPEIARLRQLLHEMDRTVTSAGHTRRQDETLSQFAQRLEENSDKTAWSGDVARWYRDYVRIRYAPPIHGEDAEELGKALPRTMSGRKREQ
jgi:hypothetical protein